MTGEPDSTPGERAPATPVDVTRIVRPGELSDEQLATWRAFQAAHDELDRPFFAPEWFRALDSAGHAVEIAVLGSAGDDRGFFPFHRQGRGIEPPGGRLSDFQGWIGPADLAVDMRGLLEAVGARAWRFNHLLARQDAAARWASDRADSPLADISEGFEAFLAAHRARGSGWVTQLPRKARKLGREVGEVRFELVTREPRVLTRLREWKRAQRERTRTFDPLDEPWAERAVERCLAVDEPGFAGVLSALYAGDELVAAHLGLRSRGTLHVWFPTYNVDRESYSPGMILMYELIRAAGEAGMTRVDFGKGPERYKASMQTANEGLAEGTVNLSTTGRAVDSALYVARRRLRGTRVATVIRGPRRRVSGAVRRLRGSGGSG